MKNYHLLKIRLHLLTSYCLILCNSINCMQFKPNDMKKALLFLIVTSLAFLYSCKTSAQETAYKLKNQVDSKPTEAHEGYVATSEKGYFMKAKINGKDWEASVLSSYELVVYAKRIIGKKGDDYIGFPFNETWDKVGNPRKLSSDGDAADLSYDLFGNGLWAGVDGEIAITKEDEKVIEGKFHFKAVSSRSNKSFNITDGYFRISHSTHKSGN